MEKLNTNNFFAIKEDELEMIDGGVVGLVLAAAGLAVGAGALYVGEYALLREIIKDRGKAAALNGK